MSSAPFRFGVLVNQEQLYPWQIAVLEELSKTGLTECVFLIVKQQAPSPKKNLSQKLLQKNLLFEQYKKLKLNPTLYKPKHYGPFDFIEKLEVKPIRSGKNYEEFENKDVEKVKLKNLDFIIRFGFGILKGEILQAAKWGVWSYHHADEQEFRGGPAGYWELVKNKRIQGVILQRLTEKLDAGKIILKRHYSVILDSYAANVTKIHMHSADMPAQAVRMISEGLMDPNTWEPVKTHAKVYHYPTNFQFIRFAIKMFFNKIKASYIRIFMQENWVVGYKEDDEIRYVTSSKDAEYFADPFIVHGKNKPLIIAEHYSYKLKKGNIVIIEPGMNQVKTVIEKKTHLSYPFVFSEGDNTYVIPEESATGKVNLYQWEAESKQVTFRKILMELPVIDPTILKHNGKYYLFGGIKHQSPNEKLFVFVADQLEGPYHSHPCNPVKCTPEGSRMGGGFITDNGTIVRPGQYSVKHYGEKLLFFKIEKLSPTEYKESYDNELLPHQNAPFKCGLHNYHKNGNFEVFDQKTMRSGFTAFKAQI
jgi:folate-dependent phosphoribosylglycinamide formyltransferase PurN